MGKQGNTDKRHLVGKQANTEDQRHLVEKQRIIEDQSDTWWGNRKYRKNTLKGYIAQTESLKTRGGCRGF